MDRPTDVPARGFAPTTGLQIYLVFGLGWLGLHVVGALGPVDGLTFVGIGLATLAAVIAGLRASEVEHRLPWWLMISAMLVWIVAGGVRVQLETLGDLSSSRSTIPDAFSLAGYLLGGTGLFLLHRRRYTDFARNVDVVLDSAIAALAVAAVTWVGLVVPVLDTESADTRVEVLLVLYPVLSVALASLTLRFVFSSTTAGVWSQTFLVLTVCWLLAGDVVYMVVEIDLLNIPQALIDLPYGIAFLSFGAAVLHPSLAEATRPVSPAIGRSSWFRLGAVSAALGVPAAVTLLGGPLQSRDRIVLGIIAFLLVSVAVWRMVRAMRDQARVHSQLAHAAGHDHLTGLPNRSRLVENLHTRLDGVDAGGVVGVVFADVDRFKLINDGLGHTSGDALLCSIAERLRDNIGSDDFVARVGGDEFVIVTVAEDAVEITDLAEQIRCCFGVPFRIGGSEVHTSLSLGVRILSTSADAAEFDTILEDADSALYQAKRKGRNVVITFDQSMRDWADKQLFLEQELREAVQHGQLRIVYQPIVRLPDGALEGFEALCRWDHPDIGPIPPDVFIPVAEETGAIVEIGSWVLDQACAQLAGWRRDGVVGQVTMSVNLSPRQLVDPNLVTTMTRTVSRHGLPGGALQLEITEGLLMTDPATARQLLSALREAGIRISLDDFGTGYSSIGQLRTFAVDSAKIDRSFVSGIGFAEPSSDESLVAAIVAMSQALGFGTVAEGVETADQADRLFELGVRSAQGFHFARPVAPEEVPDLLAGFSREDDRPRLRPDPGRAPAARRPSR